MKRESPVVAHLNDAEYKLLLDVQAKHHASLNPEGQEKYTLENVVKVEKNFAENCLNVHYTDGEWWHYTVMKTWY